MSTMMFVDHYAVLGVKRYASSKEINIAWKQFALKYHPDKCNGNQAIEEFLKVGHACTDTSHWQRIWASSPIL